ncbi:receptor-like protein 33 [Ziziphus jujuba]|uniref:Receptor-like protein 33 n=1 Tax=Ziziphus jujuba TaxID=326968 RepID=A0ABM3ZTW9_ZIZJJ|nr:receptor-like protein 33 [Ziziphus jujuba]
MKLLCFPIFIFFFSRFQLTCSSSPFYSSHDATLCPGDQKLALLQFKNTFSTSQILYEDCNEEHKVPYPKTDSWKEDVDCCLWDGVTCEDGTGNLIGLDLSCSWLYGSIHSNSSLFNLSHFQRLNLAYNNFRESEISPKFGRFSNLTHLNLSTSSFLGNMPLDLSHLTKLVSLDLSRNYGLGLNTSVYKAFARNLTQLRELSLYFHLDLRENFGLTCSLPKSNRTTSLKYLDLSICQFTGLLPMSMGNLTQITQINIQSNNFSGKIPASILNLAKLEYLILEENDFRGQIPDAFENLSQLIYVSLGRNRLIGQLPSSIFNLTQLSKIDFSFNQLSGPFPEYASGLSKLDLTNNKLQGPIPRFIFQLENLASLMLSSDSLSGVVEIGMFSKLKNMQSLELSGNGLLSLNTSNHFNFTLPSVTYLNLSFYNIQEFPPVLKAFANIERLDLSNNKIHGLVPHWFYEIGKESLEYLILSNNYLTKIHQFPWERIGHLDFHGNLLEGKLPIPPFHATFFCVSRNKLTGEVPSSICHLEQLQVLDLSYNNLSGKIPNCLGDFSYDLSILNLRMNRFEGSIPKSFQTILRSLNLNGNQFEGSLPMSLLNCSMLEVLNVGDNKLHGRFPYWFV